MIVDGVAGVVDKTEDPAAPAVAEVEADSRQTLVETEAEVEGEAPTTDATTDE